jgi:hypothetical protein
VKLIALGKKSYLDILENEDGDRSEHVRMKGIPEQCLRNYCEKANMTMEELYLSLYRGETHTIDLTDGKICFKKSKSFDQKTLSHFTRSISFR